MTTDSGEGADDGPTDFAVELARCGGLPARLIELHVSDESGRCVLCTIGDQAGRQRYPCPIRLYAAEALILQGRKRLDRSRGTPDGLWS